jgi:pSer/pThr/pTyr-binding forkhead associated (FHA) protein
MTDQVLDILKLVLLALLYLFFARVLWAVWSEVRQPADARQAMPPSASAPTPSAPVDARTRPDPTPTAGQTGSWRRNPKTAKPSRGRRGRPARLEVLEPKERRGTTYPIGDVPITVGRDAGSTVMITDDTYVSGHHATVAVSDGEVVVTDNASKNGTYLNGTRITQQRTIHTGDRLQFGATVLEAQ